MRRKLKEKKVAWPLRVAGMENRGTWRFSKIPPSLGDVDAAENFEADSDRPKDRFFLTLRQKSISLFFCFCGQNRFPA